VGSPYERALTLFRRGRYRELSRLCDFLMRSGPPRAELHQLAAAAAVRLGRTEAAVRQLKRAISLAPDEPQFPASLATLHLSMHRTNSALAYSEAARKVDPHNPKVVIIAARAHLSAGHYRRAIELAEELNENHGDSVRDLLAEAWALEGRRLLANRQYFDGIAAYQMSLKVGGERSTVLSNLGAACSAVGNSELAESCFLRAIDHNPNFLAARSNLLLSLHYTHRKTPAEVAEEHRKHGCSWDEGRLRTPAFPQRRKKDRLLRVGYLSSDFRNHPVSHFIEPILSGHDRSRFKTICYYNAPFGDATTRRIQRTADLWRPIAEFDDAEVMRLIRADQCDILVDLGGHTHGNRLGVFALRPAPVQATYLGYPNTTGLSSIQYRITDAICDPHNCTERYHTEALTRLDKCFLCYRPARRAPKVGPLPASAAGQLTFGSLNHHPKLSPSAIALWARILRAVPSARLLLKSAPLSDSHVAESTRQRFAAEGVDPTRLELHGYLSNSFAHLATYNRIDIGLDPFPYNGTTTTCEALWMGVPVLTLRGNAHVSRVGASLLTAVGLDQFIAENEDEYVERAVALSGEIEILRKIRRRLRVQMGQSLLCDSSAFIKRFENALQGMWHAYAYNINVSKKDK
jgi:protein O-GlcNAc transferase